MSQKRILIVDDEESVTRSVKMNLEKTGRYTVRAETQADKAVAVARDFRPDLILLDVMMPDVDGGDVAAELRSDPFLRNIPLIFLTALVSKAETGGHEMVSGSMHYLAKPVDLGELVKCIELHLQG